MATGKARRSREGHLDFVRRMLTRHGNGNPRLRQTLRLNIGSSLERMGQWSAAVREYRGALVESKREARRRSGPLGADMLAEMRSRLSLLASRRGHRESAEAFLRTNRRGLKFALRRWPGEECFVHRLGDTGRRLAALARSRHGEDAAHKALRSSIRDLEALASRSPASLAVQAEIAESCVALADVCEWQHREARAEVAFARAAAIYGTLLSVAPTDAFRMGLALAVQDLGRLALASRRTGRARSLFTRALELMLGVGDIASYLQAEPLRLASCVHWLARTCQIGGYEDARRRSLQAFVAYEAAARRGPKGRKWRDFGLDVAGYGTELCAWLMRAAREVGRDWEVAGYRRRGHALLLALGWRLPRDDREYHARMLDREARDP